MFPHAENTSYNKVSKGIARTSERMEWTQVGRHIMLHYGTLAKDYVMV